MRACEPAPSFLCFSFGSYVWFFNHILICLLSISCFIIIPWKPDLLRRTRKGVDPDRKGKWGGTGRSRGNGTQNMYVLKNPFSMKEKRKSRCSIVTTSTSRKLESTFVLTHSLLTAISCMRQSVFLREPETSQTLPPKTGKRKKLKLDINCPVLRVLRLPGGGLYSRDF